MIYQDLGAFVVGDTATGALVSIIQRHAVVEGSATPQPFDMTGSTSVSIEAASPERDEITIACELEGLPVDGQILTEPIAPLFTPPASRRIVHFAGIIQWTQGGREVIAEDGVKFQIERRP